MARSVNSARSSRKHRPGIRAAADNLGTPDPLTRHIGTLLLVGLENGVFPPDDVGDWLRHEVSKRLKDVPEEQIVYPDPRIVVPLIQALGYSMRDELTRALFANLLSANMDERRRIGTHPAFVEMIKEMVPLDAIMLREFRRDDVGNEHPTDLLHMSAGAFCELANIGTADLAISAGNLVRLGLVALQSSQSSPEEHNGGATGSSGTVQSQIEAIKRSHLPTPLGERFIGTCLR